MSNYCDFNIKLFDQYTSHKTKINPKVSDDWELINKAYNTNDGVALKSKKLNQIVYDIPMRRFITFCKTFNVTIMGNLLKGEFAIGQDRSVYIKDDFDKWMKKYKERCESIISLKDAKIGHVYKTKCGLSVIYLGAMYQAKIKKTTWDDLSNFTKITKVHYVQTRIDYDENNPKWGLQPVRSFKFTQDLGYALDSDEIASLFKHLYYDDSSLIYWDKERPKGVPKYGIIPTERYGYTYKSWQEGTPDTFYYYAPLFAKYEGLYWKLTNSETLRSAHSFDDVTLKYSGKRLNDGWGYTGSRDSIKVNSDFYRIGVI